MPEILHRIFFDPVLPGSFLLKPIKYFAGNLKNSRSNLKQNLNDFKLYKDIKDLIPKVGVILRLSCEQVGAFRIRDNGKSDLRFFKYDTFKVSDYHDLSYNIERVREPAYKNHSFKRILIVEATKNIVKVIYHFVLNLLFLPIILPLALIGSFINSVRICFGTSTLKRTLIIEQIALEKSNFEKIGKTAREWQNNAIKKKSGSINNEKNIFDDSSTISKLIAECMEKPAETAHLYNRITAVKDRTLNIHQSISVTKENYEICSYSGSYLGKYIKIVHIVTNPNNVRSKVNNREYTRVEGASTALIAHFAKECLKQNAKGLYLESTVSAKTFYEKIGFELLDVNDIIPDERGTYPMRLTAEKIKILQKKTCSAFAKAIAST